MANDKELLYQRMWLNERVSSGREVPGTGVQLRLFR